MKIPRIISKEEKEKIERKRSRTMTIVIVLILLASTAAFALSSYQSSEKVKYNGFQFIRTENGWQLKGTNLLTTIPPKEVENLSAPSINLNDFRRVVYFLARTNSEILAANEINRAFYNVIEKSHLACSQKYENDSFCSELPIKTCENEGNALIIEIEEAENQSISYSGNCLSIKGNEIDLIKSADRIIYSAYGIIS